MYPANYSEVPDRRADRIKRAGLEKKATQPAYLLSKSINKQGGIFPLGAFHKLCLHLGWVGGQKNVWFTT